MVARRGIHGGAKIRLGAQGLLPQAPLPMSKHWHGRKPFHPTAGSLFPSTPAEKVALG